MIKWDNTNRRWFSTRLPQVFAEKIAESGLFTIDGFEDVYTSSAARNALRIAEFDIDWLTRWDIDVVLDGTMRSDPDFDSRQDRLWQAKWVLLEELAEELHLDPLDVILRFRQSPTYRLADPGTWSR